MLYILIKSKLKSCLCIMSIVVGVVCILTACSSGGASTSSASLQVINGSINQPFSENISQYTIQFESSVTICGTPYVVYEGKQSNCLSFNLNQWQMAHEKNIYLGSRLLQLKRVESDFPVLTCSNKDVTLDGTAYLIAPYSYNSQGITSLPSYLIALDNQCYPVWYQRLVGYHGYGLAMAENGNLIYKRQNNSTYLVDNVEIFPDGSENRYIIGESNPADDVHDVIYNNSQSYINLNIKWKYTQIYTNGTMGDLLYSFIESSNGQIIFDASNYYTLNDVLDPIWVCSASPASLGINNPNYTELDHGNSIAMTNDGNIIYNSRNTSSALKINPNTGQVIWQLGGVRNQFTFVNDPLAPFMYEHFVRQLPNGNYILFDNGTTQRNFSRVVEYKLDEQNKTATLVWQFIDPRMIFAQYMGNGERLEDGNTVINYGTLAMKKYPQVEEVNYNGDVVNQIFFADNWYTYRAFKVKLPALWTNLIMPNIVAATNTNVAKSLQNNVSTSFIQKY